MRFILVLLLLIALIGCGSPALSTADSAEGSLGATSYYLDGQKMAMHAPEGRPPVHAVTDDAGADTLSGSQPIANMGFVLGDSRVFIHSPSDVSGTDWDIVMPDGTTVNLGSIGISKSDPIEAQTEIIRIMQERLASLDAEVQESVREQARQLAETVQNTVPELADILLRLAGAP